MSPQLGRLTWELRCRRLCPWLTEAQIVELGDAWGWHE